MLPNKNELNKEVIERVTGGGSYPRLLDPSQGINPTQEVEITPARAMASAGTMESSCVPLNSGKQHPVTEQHTNSETQIIPKIIPVGDDLKTAVLDISDKLVKIH